MHSISLGTIISHKYAATHYFSFSKEYAVRKINNTIMLFYDSSSAFRYLNEHQFWQEAYIMLIFISI